jgi:hypothetical protein
VYHNGYQRIADGWRFTEGVYDVKYLDTTPLAHSGRHAEGADANPLSTANPDGRKTRWMS